MNITVFYVFYELFPSIKYRWSLTRNRMHMVACYIVSAIKMDLQ